MNEGLYRNFDLQQMNLMEAGPTGPSRRKRVL